MQNLWRRLLCLVFGRHDWRRERFIVADTQDDLVFDTCLRCGRIHLHVVRWTPMLGINRCLRKELLAGLGDETKPSVIFRSQV